VRATVNFEGVAIPGVDITRCSREQRCVFSEATLVAAIMSDWPRDSIMVDVGAHHGSELRPFVDRGWRAYAFEPDPVNRADLQRRFGQHPRVNIDARAVSDVERDDVPFFRSEQSTGISTLAPFHDTHYESEHVSTVRLDRFCSERGIDRIDYLKVDTEGHDLFVLRSLDWDEITPAAVQVEFEDVKTVPLGYAFDDIAKYLTDKGFDVWVSEWHPVIAYGRRHDWARLARYPTELSNKDAWGNLLAFRRPVSEETMRAAATAALSHVADGPSGARSAQPLDSSGTKMTTSTGVSGAHRPAPSPAGLHAISRPAPATPRRRLSQFTSAYQGVLAVPAVVTALLYISAIASVFLWGSAARLPVVLLSAAGVLTLAAVGVGIARARRERERSAAALAQRIEQAVASASAQADATDVLVRDQVGELRQEVRQATVKANSFDQAGLRQELARLDDVQARDRREATGSMQDAVERVVAVEKRLAAQPWERPLVPDARSVSDEDIGEVVREWGPRLGLFLDDPVERSRKHLHYLAEAVRVAEQRSIGRLATSSHDMLLRMVVARAAARDSSARGEPLHVLEIGTLFGIGLGLLGYACRGQVDKGFTLTAVDPLSGYYTDGRPDISTGEAVDVDAFRRNMAAFPVDAEAWRVIQRTNREARTEGSVADRAYGLVVIDGDHSFDEVQYDFEEYRPLMARGCYVIFDDYGSEHWPDVQKYVDQKVSPREDVQLVGTAWRTAVVRVL
jgi:FkbM family methyltransferase